jgi:hypothetical protein
MFRGYFWPGSQSVSLSSVIGGPDAYHFVSENGFDVLKIGFDSFLLAGAISMGLSHP